MYKNFFYLIAFFAGAAFFLVPSAHASGGCYPVDTNPTQALINECKNSPVGGQCTSDPNCYWGECDAINPSDQPTCNTRQLCIPTPDDHKCIWKTLSYSGNASVSKFIPDCALQNTLVTVSGTVQGPCGDVDIYITLLLNIAQYLFAIIGALAIGAFVYGGVYIIISEGNQERLKIGIDALMAAVIGLIIVFGAYLLVRYLGEAFQIKNMFTLP